MVMEVETVVAVSLMMAVFSAVAAIGTSIVLGAGFERLRAGFDVISKQTGFFSDAIHKLEKKVEVVDEHTNTFTRSISTLEEKVSSVGEQANLFSQSMQKLEKKVDVVDKQAGFFSTALHSLEQKIETVNEHEKVVSEKIKQHAETDLISTGKAEALVSHVEDLLTQMSAMASQIQAKELDKHGREAQTESLNLTLPKTLTQYVFQGATEDGIRYH